MRRHATPSRCPAKGSGELSKMRAEKNRVARQGCVPTEALNAG